MGGQGEGPEAVVVGALGVVEVDLACLGEFVAFNIDLVEKVGVEGNVRDGPYTRGVPPSSLLARGILHAALSRGWF